MNFEDEDEDELFDENGEFSIKNKNTKVPLQLFESSGNDTLGSGFGLETYAPK